MVKRAKSPELIEEARYFTVWKPFPLNANWAAFEKDQQDCATWIAECIGLEYLYAIHYKPSARGMILLEVSKMFTDHGRLLGAHRWSEILSEPDEEEKNQVSQVFHSFYATGREAQKDGWKNINVRSTWFKGWAPGQGRFKQPYPQTSWCPIPVEDHTNKRLCRPLPADKLPPPPRVEEPVVGSATWAQKKNADNPTAEGPKMSWAEEVSAAEAIDKTIEPVQPNPNAGSSAPVLNRRTINQSIAGIATSAPNNLKSQPRSNLVPLGKNKKNKPVPLNQFINGDGAKKSTWNSPAAIPSSSLPPTLPMNEPVPKPAPRPLNAWAKPPKLPVSTAPVKKETPTEDHSSWGNEPAISNINQEAIWNGSLPKKKAKNGSARGVMSETRASSTTPGSTRPPSPQTRNLPLIARDEPPHMNTRPSEEGEDRKCEAIYVPFSNMEFGDIHDLSPEEMEHAHVNAWERGGMDPETSKGPTPATEGQVYGNLWKSEEDPRTPALPELICPTHLVVCNKGICQDMSKMIKDKKREENRAKWEEDKKKKNKGKKRKGNDASGSGSADNNDDVDGDNFTIARSKGNRRGFGKEKRTQDREAPEDSHLGRMRGFPAEPAPDGEAADAPNGAPQAEGEAGAERQLFEQW